MKTTGVSHIALGVRDMERSLSFYRDTLGFEVVRDEVQPTKGTVLPALYRSAHAERRVATLYWERAKGAAFLVLSEHNDKPVSGAPIKLDEVGIHHVGFWVEDLPGIYQELKAKGVEFVVEPTRVEVDDGTFHSAFFVDPDGILLQLDELLSS